MSAKAKIKSPKWSCKGRARSTSTKFDEGAIKNPCYFAMDAFYPSQRFRRSANWGTGSHRYCANPASHFRAISAGNGGGRDLKGIADFANGRRCAKNFGNAMD